MSDNLFHNLPTGSNPPRNVYCLVEIPKGSSNKYEYHRELAAFVLDRVLYGDVFFPTEYGIIPQTWSLEDDDPLDIMVLSSFATFTGCVLSCRPIGVIKMIDSGEQDNKIIAVPTDDPRFNDINELVDLPSHFKKEIKNFWENYAELQPHKKIEVKGWGEKPSAWKTIKEAMKNYESKFRASHSS